MILICAVGWISLSDYEVEDETHNKIGELFSGVKMQRSKKFYITNLLIRRAGFVTILVVMADVESRVVIGILNEYRKYLKLKCLN